jgi:hypothetical protein
VVDNSDIVDNCSAVQEEQNYRRRLHYCCDGLTLTDHFKHVAPSGVFDMGQKLIWAKNHRPGPSRASACV